MSSDGLLETIGWALLASGTLDENTHLDLHQKLKDELPSPLPEQPADRETVLLRWLSGDGQPRSGSCEDGS